MSLRSENKVIREWNSLEFTKLSRQYFNSICYRRHGEVSLKSLLVRVLKKSSLILFSLVSRRSLLEVS